MGCGGGTLSRVAARHTLGDIVHIVTTGHVLDLHGVSRPWQRTALESVPARLPEVLRLGLPLRPTPARLPRTMLMKSTAELRASRRKVMWVRMGGGGMRKEVS